MFKNEIPDRLSHTGNVYLNTFCYDELKDQWIRLDELRDKNQYDNESQLFYETEEFENFF